MLEGAQDVLTQLLLHAGAPQIHRDAEVPFWPLPCSVQLWVQGVPQGDSGLTAQARAHPAHGDSNLQRHCPPRWLLVVALGRGSWTGCVQGQA